MVSTHLQVLHILRLFTYAFCVCGMTLNIWETVFYRRVLFYFPALRSATLRSWGNELQMERRRLCPYFLLSTVFRRVLKVRDVPLYSYKRILNIFHRRETHCFRKCFSFRLFSFSMKRRGLVTCELAM